MSGALSSNLEFPAKQELLRKTSVQSSRLYCKIYKLILNFAFLILNCFRVGSSLVERFSDKEEVDGPIPSRPTWRIKNL